MSENSNKINSKNVFKKALTELETKYETRPEYLYRIHRWKYSTKMRVTFGLHTFSTSNGWVTKGLMAYFVYYILFKSKPVSSHWNREGFYGYDSGHHTWKDSHFGNAHY